MRTNIRITLTALAVVGLLSACELRFDQSTVVEEDGSGQVSITFALDEQFRELVASQSGEDLDFTDPESWNETGNLTEDLPEGMEYEIAPYIDGDFEGFVLSVPFDSPDQLASLAAESGEEGPFPVVTIDEDTYRIEYEFDLGDLDLGTQSDEIPVDIGSFFDVSFSATLPGEIVDTNGEVGEDGVVRWNPDLETPEDGAQPLAVLYAQSEIPGANIGLIVAVAMALIAVIGGAIWLLRRRSESPVSRLVDNGDDGHDGTTSPDVAESAESEQRD